MPNPSNGSLSVPAKTSIRLPAIDRMRGLVILLMALDHVRDFFSADALHFDPTDLTRTYPALFLTRFVTHICAPTFVFLAGSSAFLLGANLGDRRVLARCLLTRGAWLILLDLLTVSPVWVLEPGWLNFGVLWAIGFDMILLVGLVFLPPHAVLLSGALIAFGHNLLATFGRVPLFICVLHLYAAHAAAVALFLAEDFDFHQLRGLGVQAAPPEGLGLGLVATYVAWILIMAALYPACRWYAGVKRRRQDWWLSYL
jgi:uncharacterized membrane protein